MFIDKAEVEQKEKEAKAIAELEALENNKRHVGKIHKEAKESIMALGIDEATAKQIVLAISNKSIKNVTINYTK